MQWSAEAIVLGAKRHGETSAIAEVFTRERGRCAGLVRGGRSRTMRPVLQPGNLVVATWKARLEEHLGQFAIEPVAMRAAGLIDDRLALAGLGTVVAHCHHLPEREPHARLYDGLRLILDQLEQPDIWPALLVRWELGLLDELGFGLDLERCAATGQGDDLIYVSPKSGRAVSRHAGAPYRERLLALPAFLTAQRVAAPSPGDVVAGFRLTGHFIRRHILEPRLEEMPEQRQWIVTALERQADGGQNAADSGLA